MALRQALVAGELRVDVDSERYVDLSNKHDFVQRVAANPRRRRKVKREAKGVAVQVLAAQEALCGVQVCLSRRARCAQAVDSLWPASFPLSTRYSVDA